jgi:hypothetical protein
MIFNAEAGFQFSTIIDWNGSLLLTTHQQYATIIAV